MVLLQQYLSSCLTSFSGGWNSYLAVNVFINEQEKLTLPVMMKNYMSQHDQQTAVYMAGTLLAIVPPAIVFFALQKEFIGGLTSGAVKGRSPDRLSTRVRRPGSPVA